MEDIDKAIEKLNSIQNTYGIGIVFFVVLIAIILFALYKYIGRAAERAAEEASEENLKKFQAHIDKELVKFQTKHQKQVDAVHEVYQKLQQLIGMINFIIHGQKFTTSNMSPEAQANQLIQFKNDFTEVYGLNRLVFAKTLCSKIDELIPIVDQWIETFQGGILPRVEEEEGDEKNEGGLYLGGIWAVGAFDEIEEKLNVVSAEIESEFRKIYGTND